MNLFVWLDPAGRIGAVPLAWGEPANKHLASRDARGPDRWTPRRLDDREGASLAHGATPNLAGVGEFAAAARVIPEDVREGALRSLGELDEAESMPPCLAGSARS